MSGDGSHPRVVLVTAPDPETATRLARELVESRLAACANVLPGITSVYRWEGALHEDAEVLLVVKTRVAHLPAIEAHLDAHHPYDVPECIALDPSRVEAKYLAWMTTQTEPDA